MTSERKQKKNKGSPNVPTLKELMHIVSFESSSEAKTGAKLLVRRYENASNEQSKKKIKAFTRKLKERLAEEGRRKLSKIYKVAFDIIEVREFFQEVSEQHPPSEEETQAFESFAAAQGEDTASSEGSTNDRAGRNTSKENSFEPSERNTNEGRETNSFEEDETEVSEGEERTFYSTYHEYVSDRMQDFTDEERRSGDALKQIAKEWNARKEKLTTQTPDVEDGLEEV